MLTTTVSNGGFVVQLRYEPRVSVPGGRSERPHDSNRSKERQ